jgi:hypothetical protein
LGIGRNRSNRVAFGKHNPPAYGDFRANTAGKLCYVAQMDSWRGLADEDIIEQ